MRLGINIDHVATVRNARGGVHPCPVRAAQVAIAAGADGITAHLREDRRHIRDADIWRLKEEVNAPLNLEMGATEEMLAIALQVRPHAVCLVPEKRHELTTEGGLDVAGNTVHLARYVGELAASGIRVSLFIDPDPAQLEAASSLNAPVVELHTGAYAHAVEQGGVILSAAKDLASRIDIASGAMLPLRAASGQHDAPQTETGLFEYARLRDAALLTTQLGLECHAGHGLTYANVGVIAALPEVVELNIGHFLMGEALFTGFSDAIHRMREAMERGRASHSS
jgi:pyridoxine 5-phosphate synthase